METSTKFYLGRIFDTQLGKTTDQPVQYEPADLTTHAVVVGMTGSGKTGLCIDLLEEAALNNIPALMIDPKGDITNTLLHFPNLLPQDFQPWVNRTRRAGREKAWTRQPPKRPRNGSRDSQIGASISLGSQSSRNRPNSRFSLPDRMRASRLISWHH